MANQGADRRTMLQMLAKAAAASQFPGFVRWAFGQDPTHTRRTGDYRPTYYSQHEYQMIEILTEMIIPRDESPGARVAGVSEFIDFLAAHGEEALQQPMRAGLQRLDAASTRRYGKSFADLSSTERAEILKEAASAGSQGHQFFRLIRRYTVMGYYTSKVGLQELEYPGLEFYTQSPACPHTNDPEHRHLPPPRV